MSSASSRTYVRAVAVLAGGTALAQAVNVLVSPLLTRIYSPADFGQLGIYLAFFSIVLVMITLRYELALVAARSTADAAALLALCFVLLPAMALLSTLGLGLLIGLGVGDYASLSPALLPLVFAALVAGGALAVLRYWVVRHQGFRRLSGTLLAQSLGRAAGQLGLGLLGHGGAGLIVGDGVGRLAGVRTLAGGAVHELRAHRADLSRETLIAAAREHWRFPVLSVPSSVINVAAGTLPAPLIAAFFGIGPAGLFVLVERVLALPAAVIGNSVADVFHARLAQTARSSTTGARVLVLRTSGGLLLVGIPLAIAVFVAGETAFTLVFGPSWAPAGEIAAAMMPWTLAGLAVSPVSRTVFVLSGQGLKLTYDVASLAISIGTLVVATQLELDVVDAIWVLSIGQALAYAWYFAVILRIAGRSGIPAGQTEVAADDV